MALLVIEPYHRYAAIADLGTDNDNVSAAWVIDTGGSALDATGGRFSAKTLEFTRQGDAQTIRLPTVTGSTIIVAGAVKFDPSGSTAASVSTILRVTASTGATGIHAGISVTAGGNLYIFRNGGSVLVGSVQAALQHDTWHYLEVKVDCSNSGSLTIKVDGVQVFTVSATDFLHSTTDISAVMLSGNHDNFWWEDVVIMDGSGSTFNDFMGDMRFESTVPDADGATVDWTPSAGSNFQCIDDTLGAYNDDTDYISSSTTDQDNYASHSAISASGASTIHFAGLFALARADAAGDKLALHVDSGGTINRGADQALINGTYRWRKQVWETDPNTSSAWTVSNINAATFGVRKRV